MLGRAFKHLLFLICFATFYAGVSTATNAHESSDLSVDFDRDIFPILERSCLSCHGATEPKGQLRLVSGTLALKGGLSGAAIVPGKPEESAIYVRITATDSDLRMPFDQDALRPEEIALIRSWIEQGAAWPEINGATAIEEKHWAYVKPTRPKPPAVKNDAWIQNPIDAFILARLEHAGLEPSPEASKEQLIRRVYLDLIGLPPSPEQVDAYIADSSNDAYEKVLDSLLASPHYGERWAQPWLDAARYADSNGFTNDRRRSIWPFRDWVIEALNADMPFDQFTIEQIAGDMLPNATVEQQIATGFHRNTMWNDEQGVDQGEGRWNAMVDRVGTTGTVWLGTTLACAQCHNHKYDPFSQKDFYGLLAFFENVDFTMVGEALYDRKYVEPVLDLTSPDVQKQRQALEGRIAEQKKNLASIPHDSSDNEEQRQARTSAQSLLDQLTRDLDALSKDFSQTLIMREPSMLEPLTTHLRIKGSYLSKGEEIPAAVPAMLHPLPPDSPRNRLSLARWLVDPDNPLTVRVIVNRHWAQFFGRGLVETEEDFGARGARPSHPELLDWLATEFQRLGWSTKQLHKTIVMSSTYCQSSAITPQQLERDPDNRLLARGPRFRLNAEFVRDTTLAISGLLNKKIGGPCVFPPQPMLSPLPDHGDFAWIESQGEDRYRRSIYTFWRRSALHPALINFDAPSRESCTVKRMRSNTPLQALTQLNDQTAFEAAISLAKRIRAKSSSEDISARATFAFRLCTCRYPTSRELDALVQFYSQGQSLMQGDPASLQKIAASAGLASTDIDFATWFLMSQALLNLDETLTKE